MKDTTQLFKQRHSLAHLLATVILERDPEAKIAIGPVVDDGFYYDFQVGEETTFTDKDLKEIEKRMRKLIGQKIAFEQKEISADEARELFKDQPYKLELIEQFAGEGQAITVYESGTFTDLCEGPHVENTSEIDAKGFKIDRVAGAYWRADESNAMLTRIYGLAFENREELDAHLKKKEEAKKRDHRKLGKELGLFTFSELVGPGLPLWTPKGTYIRTLLDEYVWEMRKKYGYEKVTIPHITKQDLYEKSGHWEKFGEELYKVNTREGKVFALKPMNCPHHTQIFDSSPRSYKDMPQRYCETTMVYRDEQSGELGGLTRVLSITQDDSHVFCRKSQIKQEFFQIWDIIDKLYATFNFTDMKVRLSFADPEHPEKYLGEKGLWDYAQNSLRELAKERGVEYFEAEGEAAMYGPKLDFMVTDSLGREHQVATIQLDVNLPERFDLTCKNEEGEDERVVMIHSAIMGSIERFSAVLIEHLAGVFPFWLSPVQIRVLPIADAHKEYAEEVFAVLKAADIRVELDDDNESLGKKIRTTKVAKVPYFLVLGDEEVSAKTVTLEGREGKVGSMSISDLLDKLKDEVKNRTIN